MADNNRYAFAIGHPNTTVVGRQAWPVMGYTEGGVTTLLDSTGGPLSVAGGEVPSYTGQVATRTIVPMRQLTTAKYLRARKMSISRDRITALRCRFPNFMALNAFTTPVGTGEAGPGGAATISAAVEYPAGVYTALRFSGSLTGTIADNGSLDTDSCTVTIPKNAVFWIRTWVNFPGAGNPVYTLWSAADNNYTVCGDAFQYSDTALADNTQGGEAYINNIAGGAVYGPTAIYGTTTQRSFCIVGDSRQSGLSTIGNYDASGDIGVMARSIGPKRAYITASTGGDRMQYWSTSNTNRAELLALCSDTIIAGGINDVSAGTAAATIFGYLATIAGLAEARGSRVWYGTIHPNTTDGAGTWLTYAAQTVTANEAIRLAVNNSIRTGTSGTQRFTIDTADFAEVSATGFPQRDSGRWPFNGTANAYTPDGLHESAQFNRWLAATGFVTNKIGI